MRYLLILLAALATAAEPSWQPVEVVATAYCPCRICCGVRGVGITADGTDTREVPYGIAADPNQIPYGTSVWIPLGVGYLDRSRPQEEDRVFLCDDTGGSLRQRNNPGGTIRVDLRFKYHGSAKRFGVRKITIFVWR